MASANQDVQMRLQGLFKRQLQRRLLGHKMQVGILVDGPHKNALPAKRGLKSLAGQRARKTGLRSTKKISEVAREVQASTGINLFKEPFKIKANKTLRDFIKSFMVFALQRKQVRRLENALQAVIRNPITRHDYGSNSKPWSRVKTFNWLFVDTGQLFRAIRAKVTRRR